MLLDWMIYINLAFIKSKFFRDTLHATGLVIRLNYFATSKIFSTSLGCRDVLKWFVKDHLVSMCQQAEY